VQLRSFCAFWREARPMSTRERRRHAKSKREPGGFVAMPYIVIRSDQFARLSAHAIKLLVDLLAQYHGDNNGDLCATWTVMHPRGWRSRDTLEQALAELVERGFVTRTRQGGKNSASLYAVTFYSLDDDPKLEIRAAEFQRTLRGAWARVQRTDGPRRRKRCHARRANLSGIDTPIVSRTSALDVN
jgi:hypothetical protein